MRVTVDTEDGREAEAAEDARRQGDRGDGAGLLRPDPLRDGGERAVLRAGRARGASLRAGRVGVAASAD